MIEPVSSIMVWAIKCVGGESMEIPKTILKEILSLKPANKAELVDRLLSSLDKPDKEIDALWVQEAEERIDAYEKGELKAVSLEEVLNKYK